MENNMSENNITNMPLLALRGLVIYPEMMVHFDVVRKKSIDAINAAMSAEPQRFPHYTKEYFCG